MEQKEIFKRTDKIDACHFITEHFEGDYWLNVMLNAVKPEVKTITAYINKSSIRLIYEDIYESEPVSVPARFLVILCNRFKKVSYFDSAGINIITPFLLDEYVKKLEAFVIELAHANNCDPGFIDWIESKNYFGNSITN